ncbi:MAG TPA: hypothetical protein H9680_05450 [Firmicutes bacterium]|nr:hypothetical protein [Bacillota bacterium]
MNAFEEQLDRELSQVTLDPAAREAILRRAAHPPLGRRLAAFLGREVEIPLAPAAAFCAAAVMVVSLWAGRLTLSPQQLDQSRLPLILREAPPEEEPPAR